MKYALRLSEPIQDHILVQCGDYSRFHAFDESKNFLYRI